jgi:hypothetical protein
MTHFVIYESRHDSTIGPELFGPFGDEQAAINWAVLKKSDPKIGKGGWDGKFTITEVVPPEVVTDPDDELDYSWPNKMIL